MSENTTKRAWRVTPAEGFEDGGNYMQASCHHRIGRGVLSACGGCYARLSRALDAIEETGDATIAADVRKALQAEGAALRARRSA